MNYSYFIIFDKDMLVFQFIDFILESIYLKEQQRILYIEVYCIHQDLFKRP